MAGNKVPFMIPGAEDKARLHRMGIGWGTLRPFLQALFSLDFHGIVEGTVGNLLGISRGLFLTSIFLGLFVALWQLIPGLPLFAFAWLVGLAPLWVPVAMGYITITVWVWYVQSNYLATREGVLLEVKMPKNLVKSPRAMELVLTSVYNNSGETTYFDRLWDGSVRAIYSLEIVTFGGQLRMYVWTWKSYKWIWEAALYSQYPEVEITEVEDYARKFAYDPEKHKAFCTDLRYEPRNDAYPLKSYLEFELDKDPEEEYKTDPLANVLEFMGSFGPHETGWMQFVITSYTKGEERRAMGAGFFQTKDRYVSLAKEEADKLRQEAAGDPNDPEERWKQYSRIPRKDLTTLIDAIERNASKFAFHVSARVCYFAPEEHFRSSAYSVMRYMWNPVGNPTEWNYLRPRRWHTPFDYPYQDPFGTRWHTHARRFFDCYRRRAPFYHPYLLPTNVMSTEVIATLWHPPSVAVVAPGLERIPAKKAEAPVNLPR